MATEGQNFNGYLWKMTDKYGNEGYLVTETPDMEGNVLATNVEKSVYGGEEHYYYTQFSFNAVTLEDVSAATTTKIARVDYNKRPVTVKNYSLDYIGAGEYTYESTLQSVEEYGTRSVSLDELISVSRTAIGSIPYGATILIIDGDVLVDGKPYSDFWEELENYAHGSVYLDRTGEITGFDQGTLTGYDMTNEMFDPNEGGKVISIIGVGTVG